VEAARLHAAGHDLEERESIGDEDSRGARMNTKRQMFASTLALVPIALVPVSALATGLETRESESPTALAVAALKTNLGESAPVEVDEVRVTSNGVACIDYRIGTAEGAKSVGHAVVQGGEVLKSSSDAKRFEEEWNKHCLGPRGGGTGGE
jgi:hypothetical protein